jgi:hypothetical protein
VYLSVALILKLNTGLLLVAQKEILITPKQKCYNQWCSMIQGTELVTDARCGFLVSLGRCPTCKLFHAISASTCAFASVMLVLIRVGRGNVDSVFLVFPAEKPRGLTFSVPRFKWPVSFTGPHLNARIRAGRACFYLKKLYLQQIRV